MVLNKTKNIIYKNLFLDVLITYFIILYTIRPKQFYYSKKFIQ